LENIAIVILNWNGKDWLEQFLPSVIKHSGSARIVVADNASEDDSVKYLQEDFPSIELVQNATNGGFAKGYNDALKKITAEFYVLLNNDIEVTENWLAPLMATMQNKNVAGCQPKILSYARKTQFEHAGAAGGFIDKNYFPFCRGRLFNEVENDSGQYDGESEIFWASGACLMIRSELFHKVGGFDEDFFAHMEEIDLCWRLKKMNYSFMVSPTSVVYHVGGGTLPYNSSNKIYLNFRNNLIMIAKNHEGPLFFKLFYRMILDGIAGAKFLFSREYKSLFAVFKAHYSFRKDLFKKTLKKRKAIKEQSTEFNAKGYYSGSILWAFFFKKIRKFEELNQRLFK
jgi:GT2 family glycosyltransferase